MTVVLKSLELRNFRSHRSFSLDEPKRLVLIVGKNAVGKTNVIEALQLVSMLESFRNPLSPNLVTKSEEEGDVKASFLQNERQIDIKMSLSDGKRSYELNGKNKPKNSIKGLIPAIVFVPDDLSLVKDAPEGRRKLVDDIGQQLSSTYRDISCDYQKTVRQRNVILREQRERNYDRSILESWDESLFTLGALLFVHRAKLYKRLMDKARAIYSHFIEGEVLKSIYLPSFSHIRKTASDYITYSDEALVALSKEEVESLMREALELVHKEEKARAKTLVGPHRDEVSFFINGQEARRFASQGQQRSIALSLKLAQLAVIQEITGNQPLLLLDDVMSELDEERREALIEMIEGEMQTVITATDLSFFNEDILSRAQIIELGT
jgi:DNA replication and repair protein RecF